MQNQLIEQALTAVFLEIAIIAVTFVYAWGRFI